MTRSDDIRKLAFRAYHERHWTATRICAAYDITRKTFYNWRKEYDQEETFKKTKKKRKPKKSKYSQELVDYIKENVVNNHCFRIKTLIDKIKEIHKITLNQNAIYYILKKSNITFKKARRVVIINKAERETKVKELIENVKQIGTKNIISIDECHFETNLKPTNGWSPKGERTEFIANSGVRKRLTLLNAISEDKIVHYELISGKVDANVYLNFLKKITMKYRYKTLLMDNARIHHAKIIKKHMDGKTNKILYNVAYNPKTNPVEQSFNKSKAYVKKENTETESKLKTAIVDSLNQITKNDLKQFFKHSFN